MAPKMAERSRLLMMFKWDGLVQTSKLKRILRAHWLPLNTVRFNGAHALAAIYLLLVSVLIAFINRVSYSGLDLGKRFHRKQ